MTDDFEVSFEFTPALSFPCSVKLTYKEVTPGNLIWVLNDDTTYPAVVELEFGKSYSLYWTLVDNDGEQSAQESFDLDCPSCQMLALEGTFDMTANVPSGNVLTTATFPTITPTECATGCTWSYMVRDASGGEFDNFVEDPEDTLTILESASVDIWMHLDYNTAEYATYD